jgi:hypothetical protein
LCYIRLPMGTGSAEVEEFLILMYKTSTKFGSYTKQQTLRPLALSFVHVQKIYLFKDFSRGM